MIDGALGELADFCGIEPGYHDIWGVWREASPATVRALLGAMGVDLSGADGEERALRALLAERWSRMLPETVVVRRSALSRGVLLRLPEPQSPVEIAWRIELEEGGERTGAASLAQLPLSEDCAVDGVRRCAVLLPLPEVPAGYHRLELRDEGRLLAGARLVVVPEQCYKPRSVGEGARHWGVVLQLYGLRSGRNLGIGDFGDLSEAGAQWVARGASFVGVNPLHALYLADPGHASPYSPSSRLFLNPLYLDVRSIEEFARCEEARTLWDSEDFAARAGQLRASPMVDYEGVAGAKMRVLELLHRQFLRDAASRSKGRARGFGNFRRERGESLRLYALYEVLHAHFRGIDAGVGSWQQWPEPYRNPASDEVARFAAKNEDAIGFIEYLQWQSASQLAAAHAVCRHGGIGLYLDLAVSIDRGGAEAWANQGLYALGASVGAPPDDFNADGQNWGLPPCNPEALRKSGFAALIETLRANMASAGALRIDHVMGLARLFWLPGQGGAREGAYVRYPLEDLLGIIALESQRHGCMVIGEDLGTVPVQLRHALREWGVLSYRLLMFERDSAGRFIPRGEYPAHAMVAFSTHDLPTFAGYWKSQDAKVRKAMISALRSAGSLPQGVDAEADPGPERLAKLSHAVHLYLARSASLMLSVQLDDLAGACEQANVPGTPDRAPNWRRKLPATLEEMKEDARLAAIGAELSEARGSGSAAAA